MLIVSCIWTKSSLYFTLSILEEKKSFLQLCFVKAGSLGIRRNVGTAFSLVVKYLTYFG